MQGSSPSEKVDTETSEGTSIKSIPITEGVKDDAGMVVDDEVDSNITNPMESLSVTKSVNGTPENKRLLETVKMLPQPVLPSCSVPERIVIVVDKSMDEDEENLPFETSNGKKYSSFDMVKRAVTMFMYNKASINNKHQFALMFLNEDSAEWVLDFQNSPAVIVNALNVKPCGSKEFLKLETLFHCLEKKTTLFSNSPDKQCNSPPYIVRVLFTFTRSKCLPILNKTPAIRNILNSPFFYFDVIMSHGPSSDDNQCDQYFKYLTGIDIKGNSYAYSVGRSCKELHEAAAKLLSHPLQRPVQSEACYNLPKTEEKSN